MILGDQEIEASRYEVGGVEITVNRPRNLGNIWRRLGLPPESPIRDYVWGAVIIVFGALTILGVFFLFGR
jgi:hypothetical protein